MEISIIESFLPSLFQTFPCLSFNGSPVPSQEVTVDPRRSACVDMLLDEAAQNQNLSSQMKDFDNCNRDDEIPVSNGPWGLFSCFRDQDELELGSVDEVTKPLYFIVEEVSSQQVRDFSVEAEIHPHHRNEHQHYSIEPIPVQSMFRRKLSTLLNRGPRGRLDSATASITRVESAVATNETKSDRKYIFRARNEQLKRLSLKPIKRSFLCLSKKAKRLLQYSAGQSPVMRSGYVGFGGSDGSDTSSEEMWEPGSPRILGVSFPHPAFVGDDASRRAFSPKRSAWGRHDAEKKQEALLLPAQYELSLIHI